MLRTARARDQGCVNGEWILSQSTARHGLLSLLLVSSALALNGCTLLLDFDQCATDSDCSEGSQCVSNICEVAPGAERVHVNDVIATPTTWTADKVWILDDLIPVTASGTLTIEPGTTVLGNPGSALIVESGGKLIAEGTREAPIVFSSSSPVGRRRAGDWGGVAMLGKASVNRDNASLRIFPAVEGDPVSGENVNFGGSDDTWNCGSLKYVRIEFGGGRVRDEEALNGITLAGCGSETQMSYVQVHLGADDGVEIFGGTVNMDHILVTRAQDDGFDIDLGWRGRAQFVAILQDAAGDNAVEIDNLGEDPTKLPLTDFDLYNFTLISDPEAASRGITFKAGGIGTFSHGIVMGHGLEAIDVFGQESGALANEGRALVERTLFYEIGDSESSGRYFPNNKEDGEQDPNTEDPAPSDDAGFEEDVFYVAAERNNVFGVNPGIPNVYDLFAPGWVPSAQEIQTIAPPAPFDATAVYKGAFAPGQISWTDAWTAYPGN